MNAVTKAPAMTIRYWIIDAKLLVYSNSPGTKVIPIPVADKPKIYVSRPPTAPPNMPETSILKLLRFTPKRRGSVIPNKVDEEEEIALVLFNLTFISKVALIAAPNCPAILAVISGFSTFSPVSASS